MTTWVKANGDTLLHVCAEFDREAIMRLLTETFDKWNINKENKAGETPLMLAAREGHVAIIKFMFEIYKVDEESPNSKTKGLIVDAK